MNILLSYARHTRSPHAWMTLDLHDKAGKLENLQKQYQTDISIRFTKGNVWIVFKFRRQVPYTTIAIM